jgi:large subunit ribosomal protein L10
MPTAEKSKSIEKAKEWYSKSSGVVFTDYRGLKVKELQGLRSDLRKKGAEIHVLKNTLFRIAAGEAATKLPPELHNGTTAFAFVFENETDVAKVLVDYARTSKKLIVKGGLFGGRSLTAKEVEQLSQLPPRDVLISQVIGAIAAPLTTLIGTIEALYADPIRTIGAVADKVAESAPASETSAPTPVAELEPAAIASEASGEAVTAEPVEIPAPEPVAQASSEQPTQEPVAASPEAPPEDTAEPVAEAREDETPAPEPVAESAAEASPETEVSTPAQEPAEETPSE